MLRTDVNSPSPLVPTHGRRSLASTKIRRRPTHKVPTQETVSAIRHLRPVERVPSSLRLARDCQHLSNRDWTKHNELIHGVCLTSD